MENSNKFFFDIAHLSSIPSFNSFFILHKFQSYVDLIDTCILFFNNFLN